MSWPHIKLILPTELDSSSTLRDLGDQRDEEEFTNVTLAYEDGWQAEAHKLVLALIVRFPNHYRLICLNRF